MKKRIVLALGGNALQKNGETTAEAQKKVAASVASVIAKLTKDYDFIITHGNGPQVGNLLIHEETAATAEAPAMPLETAVAMSQGQIGYWLAQALDNAITASLPRPVRGTVPRVATVISQVIVDRNDPAFKNPTKPIGQFYSAKEAKSLANSRGWTLKEDSGRGWRRVVPSPKPIDIVEKDIILSLVDSGTIVIAVGGGGIPVVKTRLLGHLKGIDAVIDKDYAAEKLAELTHANYFISVTAVPNVYLNYGLSTAQALHRVSVNEIRNLTKYGYFKAGSMLPKVEAAALFAEHGGIGIITDIGHLEDALRGNSGTIIS